MGVPCVSKGWIGRLPEIAELRQQLTDGLEADDYQRAWEQRQALDLQTTRNEVLEKLRELDLTEAAKPPLR